MSDVNTDTVIHYLHRQESPNQYRVSFFRTAEERNSEADKWRLSHLESGLGCPENGEICLYRAIEWHENEGCSRCKVDDPRSLFPSWYQVHELAYA